jgi:threonine/homoserine/homoserine lactone efflux protein
LPRLCCELFAAVTIQLLAILGLVLVGGILLLWVCWKMWRELRTSQGEGRKPPRALSDTDYGKNGVVAGRLA